MANSKPPFHVDPSPTQTWNTPVPQPSRPGSEVLSLSDTIEVGWPLGEGGMGVVHAGFQRQLGRYVAIKRLHDNDPAAAEMLMREARIAGRLTHPGIVPIHGILHDPVLGPGVVMKRLIGSTWKQVMQQGSALVDPMPHVRIAIALCRALEYAHAHDVFHLDLKPSNVIIGEFGETQLLDWGVALDLQEEGCRTVVRGSPAYMAPEMFTLNTATPVGPRSDVYLLAASLYEALFHRPPHQEDDPRDSMFASLHPVRFPRLPPGVLLGLVEIVARALEVDPNDRYSSIAELREALEHFEERFQSDRMLSVLNEELTVDPSADLHLAQSRLESARSLWPDAPLGEHVREQIAELWVRQRLESGDVQGAVRSLSEIDSPDPQLVRAVEVAQKADEEQRYRSATERLRHVERRVDHRLRGGLLAMLSVALMAMVWDWLINYRQGASLAELHSLNVRYIWAFLLICSAPVVWYYERLMRNEQSAALVRSLMTAAFFSVALRHLAMEHQLEIHVGNTIELGVIGALLSLQVGTLAGAEIVAALAILGALGCALFPSQAHLIYAMAVLPGFLGYSAYWLLGEFTPWARTSGES